MEGEKRKKGKMVNENKNGYNLSVNGVIKKLFLGVLENCYYLGYFILFF